MAAFIKGVVASLLVASGSFLPNASANGSKGQSHLDNYRGMATDVHPATEAQSLLLQNMMTRIELKEGRRSDRVLRKDLWLERATLEELREELKLVDTIAGGRVHSFHSIRQFYSLTHRHSNDDVYSAMRFEIGELEAADFGFHHEAVKVLDSEGLLHHPPHLLTLNGTCHEQFPTVRATWKAYRVAVNNRQKESDASQLQYSQAAEQFRADVAQYAEAADEALKNVDHGVARHEAITYLRSLKGLAGLVYRGEQVPEIIASLASGGANFKGGTIDDLVWHLYDNRLCIEQGSKVQKALLPLTDALRGHLLTQIATREEQKQRLKEEHRWFTSSGSFLPGATGQLGQVISNSLQ